MTLLACTVEGIARRGTILFISGFVGSRRSWGADFRSLAREFKVVMIDTLGFGESPKPDLHYTVEDHVGAIHDTLTAQGIQCTHIVGHSMGCLLALAYAHHHPTQVEKLALLALPYFESESQARDTIRNGSTFNRWMAMDTPFARAACSLMCMLRPMLQPLAPYLIRDVPDVVAKDVLNHNWQSYSHTLRNVIFRGATPLWIAKFKREILLIHGTRDTTAPITNVQPLTVMSNVRLLSVDAGHNLIFSQSEWIVQRLTEFLGNGTGSSAGQSVDAP